MSSGDDNSSPDDQPCDLRLLTPATCLRELSSSQTILQTAAGAGPSGLADLPPTNISIYKNLSLLSSIGSGSGSSSGNHGPTAGGSYTCKRCGNSYARPHSLNRHIRFECGVEPKFECPICHKKSKHKHNLVLHMRTHQQR